MAAIIITAMTPASPKPSSGIGGAVAPVGLELGGTEGCGAGGGTLG